jgi:hypothetical protein
MIAMELLEQARHVVFGRHKFGTARPDTFGARLSWHLQCSPRMPLVNDQASRPIAKLATPKNL